MRHRAEPGILQTSPFGERQVKFLLSTFVAQSFSINKNDGTLQLPQYRLFPLGKGVIKKSKKVGLLLHIHNPQKIKELSFELSLYRKENSTVNSPSEKIESLMGKESKRPNEVYLLDFQQVFTGDYKLCIKSLESGIDKSIEIKLIH